MTAATGETPLQRYHAELARLGWREDAGQAAVMQQLQRLHQALQRGRPRQTWYERLRRRPVQPVRGLYLWGGTGRGKTWLMDIFFDCLPLAEKSRLHFHAFMQEVHSRLQQLPKTPDPLPVIAREWSRRLRLLCLDEFHVGDIGDAMLLGGLLQALFDRGITLVATSNLPPDELYLDGLQRDRFLFAVDLLKRHTEPVHLQGEADYRCAHLDSAGSYHIDGDDGGAEARMHEHLARLTPEPAAEAVELELNRRRVRARALAGDLAWFDFAELCERPLWAADYLELARRFHTLLLSGVPVMDETRDDAAKRFMHLIDALYDHNVKLVISAAAAPAQLYTGRYLQFAFQRTASRLTEMAGHRYLARAHRI
ncbi:cell division protein ZapE [Thiohalobacter thiocyanaticus]|uniref:cell division protein ZapE n=1 Tax=Thiohalobacter thiocyanaticus TaxID=585455 RepID=UPI001F4E6056|nr:cell division protein ZapE [Thiohalobacter thiocyanaticus]